MVCPVDQRFPKSARLRKRSEYLLVQNQGRAVHSRAFVGVFLVEHDKDVRLGITTTRRLGDAVVRNRTRRLIREAYRHGIISLPAGTQLVIIAKRSAIGLPARAVFEDLALLGNRVRAATGDPA